MESTLRTTVHRLEVGVSLSVLSLVSGAKPPLHKTWQELQGLRESGGVDVPFRMWVFLFVSGCGAWQTTLEKIPLTFLLSRTK